MDNIKMKLTKGKFDSLIQLSNHIMWSKVKVLGALLLMSFIYIAALMGITSVLNIEPIWMGIVIVFSFGLLVAAIYGMKLKTKIPGAEIDAQPTIQDWDQQKIPDSNKMVIDKISSINDLSNLFNQNKSLGLPQIVALTDPNGHLKAVISDTDLAPFRLPKYTQMQTSGFQPGLENIGTPLTPNDATVLHTDRLPVDEVERISGLPLEKQKYYMPLVDKNKKVEGFVSREKLLDLAKPTSINFPIEIEF